MKQRLNLEGHLPANHLLSPHWQFSELPLIGRMLTDYRSADLWQSDFAQLPRALRNIRHRARRSRS